MNLATRPRVLLAIPSTFALLVVVSLRLYHLAFQALSIRVSLTSLHSSHPSKSHIPLLLTACLERYHVITYGADNWAIGIVDLVTTKSVAVSFAGTLHEFQTRLATRSKPSSLARLRL